LSAAAGRFRRRNDERRQRRDEQALRLASAASLEALTSLRQRRRVMTSILERTATARQRLTTARRHASRRLPPRGDRRATAAPFRSARASSKQQDIDVEPVAVLQGKAGLGDPGCA